MATWNFIIYRKVDFSEIDFNGDIVTKSAIVPIEITVEDNDGFLGGSSGTSFEDTDGQQTIVSSSDPSLVGQSIRVENANGASDRLYNDDGTNNYSIDNIAIGGVDDFVMYRENNVNAELTPSTTYTENNSSVGTAGIVYSSSALPPCFTAGTLISTPAGPVPVERLKVGDLMITMDHGPQPIRWITGRRLDQDDLAHRPELYPIRIAAGALGRGLPKRDLLVSPQHRMLIRSKIVERVLNVNEALIAAKKLLGTPGVDIDARVDHVTYFHFMCASHEIVFAENSPTETLYPGPETLKMIGSEALAELNAIFPDLKTAHGDYPRSRKFPDGKKSKAIILRHKKNNKPLYLQ